MKRHIQDSYVLALFAFVPFSFGPTDLETAANFAAPSAPRAISPVDNPDVLSVRGPLEKNLYTLDQNAPRETSLGIKPWADSRWKMKSGLIAERYDAKGNSLLVFSNWSSNHGYILSHPVSGILKETDARKRADGIDRLSPAEKYDLLVGDDRGTLAETEWSEGEKYARNGTLAGWMGICEGSAAASVMFPEPRKRVTLKARNGDPVVFHIRDIKALASLLWSSYNNNIPISGSRCYTDHPLTDSHGTVIDGACFDSNPASWHIGMLNLLGLRKQPLIMNRYVAKEVWNVPVLSYDLHYFNVKSGKHVQNLKEAVLPVGEFPSDPYRLYRARGTASLVGVSMRAKWASGHSDSRDSTSETKPAEVLYEYDLELDSSGFILGGEWHQRSHPDFIWAVDPAFDPLSKGDLRLGAAAVWDGGAVPEGWLDAIRLASLNNQPLAVIVKKLVELSQ